MSNDRSIRGVVGTTPRPGRNRGRPRWSTWLTTACRYLLSIVYLSPPVYADSLLAPTGFEQPLLGRVLEFPRDHGAHRGFRTEWWYFTGHLVPKGEDIFSSSDRYGFQLTFFRSSRRPHADNLWNDRFLAHGALTDARFQRFSHSALMGTPAIGTAGASAGELNVFVRTWSARAHGRQLTLQFAVPGQKSAQALSLVSDGFGETIVAQGHGGISQKGPCEVCRSVYYSAPRIPLTGRIELDGRTLEVSGLGWMDHEFMSSALLPSQAGWDWISLMLEDGRSVMLFRVRGREGFPDFYGGTVHHSDGEQVSLQRGDFSLEPVDFWRSPHTGARYPVVWQVSIPSEKLELRVHPVLRDQEVHVTADGATPVYWEGAITTEGAVGIGYLEMTGYDRPLGALF